MCLCYATFLLETTIMSPAQEPERMARISKAAVVLLLIACFMLASAAPQHAVGAQQHQLMQRRLLQTLPKGCKGEPSE